MMDRIFGMWYENRFVDAGAKTLILIILMLLALSIYNFAGGAPKYDFSRDFNEISLPILAIAIFGFGAFYYASNAHRKYRHHLSKRAEILSQRLREKKRR